MNNKAGYIRHLTQKVSTSYIRQSSDYYPAFCCLPECFEMNDGRVASSTQQPLSAHSNLAYIISLFTMSNGLHTIGET